MLLLRIRFITFLWCSIQVATSLVLFGGQRESSSYEWYSPGTGQCASCFWLDWLWKMLKIAYTSNHLTSSGINNIALCPGWCMREIELVGISFLISYVTKYALVIKQIWYIRFMSMNMSTNKIVHGKLTLLKLFLRMKTKSLAMEFY